MRRKFFLLCITFLFALTCNVTVSAEEFEHERLGSVSVTLTEQSEKIPIVGAELSLYYVATAGVNTDGKLNYIFTDAFDEIDLSMDDPELALKLEDCISRTNIKANRKITNENGDAFFPELLPGLYLIRQTTQVDGFALCNPFIVTVPFESEDGYVYDVNATPKTEVAKLVSVTIRKVWNTDASTKAVDQVAVQLLRDGELIKTAVLNEENAWQVTFTELPESDSYSIKELDVPEGFVATYKQSGYVFTVTNTPALAQTGQLIWPLPVLTVAGVFLLWIGFALLRKKEKADA